MTLKRIVRSPEPGTPASAAGLLSSAVTSASVRKPMRDDAVTAAPPLAAEKEMLIAYSGRTADTVFGHHRDTVPVGTRRDTLTAVSTPGASVGTGAVAVPPHAVRTLSSPLPPAGDCR